MRDPHSVLGVGRNASRMEIKLAYRKLAKRWHPDRHDGDARARARFVEISDAYRLLSATRRAGKPERQRRPARPETFANASQDAGESHSAVHESDEAMMERIFGVSPKRAHIDDAPGLDSVGTEAPAEEAPAEPAGPKQNRRAVRQALNAIFGRRRHPEAIDLRGAPGAEAASDTDGAETETAADFFDVAVPLALIVTGGPLDVRTPEGAVSTLDIARGTPNGTRMPLPASESCVKPNKAVLRYASSDVLWHDESGLHAVLAIDIATAVLGGKMDFTTLDGGIRLTVPPWSGSDRVLRVPARGLPGPEGEPRGDLLVHLRVLLGEAPDGDIVALMKARRQGCHV